MLIVSANPRLLYVARLRGVVCRCQYRQSHCLSAFVGSPTKLSMRIKAALPPLQGGVVCYGVVRGAVLCERTLHVWSSLPVMSWYPPGAKSRDRICLM